MFQWLLRYTLVFKKIFFFYIQSKALTYCFYLAMCYSWQLVSGTGSVKGYASARDSPLTVHSPSDLSSGSSGAGSGSSGGLM